MSKIFLIIIFLFGLCNTSFSLTFSNGSQVDDQEKFNFTTYETYDFSRFSSGKYLQEKVNGKGSLFIPDNISENQKVPLVIILHTAGGVANNVEIAYARYFKDLGYASFVVDSFGSRNCDNSGDDIGVCTDRITILDLTVDAYSALQELSMHPNIDPNRTSLIGFSYGGDAAMLALDAEIKNEFVPTIKPFSSVISVYGGCYNKFNTNETIGSDFFYIVGTLDVSYNKDNCDNRFNELRSSGIKPELFLIEGAVHLYDANFPILNVPIHEIPDFWGCEIEVFKDGTIVENITNTKINFESEQSLKSKYKIWSNFWGDIKDCYGNKPMRMGSQPSKTKITKEYLEDILQKTFNR